MFGPPEACHQSAHRCNRRWQSWDGEQAGLSICHDRFPVKYYNSCISLIGQKVKSKLSKRLFSLTNAQIFMKLMPLCQTGEYELSYMVMAAWILHYWRFTKKAHQILRQSLVSMGVFKTKHRPGFDCIRSRCRRTCSSGCRFAFGACGVLSYVYKPCPPAWKEFKAILNDF